MAKITNAQRYSHISTNEIVKLHDQGRSHRQIAKILGMGPCSVGNRLRREGKRRDPPRLTNSQLAACRADPAWEARGGTRGLVPANRAVCRECGELKSELNASGAHSHLRKHEMTARDYRSKYPAARLVSFARTAEQNRRQGRRKTLQQLMDKFTAMYVTPMELKECRRDPEWENRSGINDFMACRVWPQK